MRRCRWCGRRPLATYVIGPAPLFTLYACHRHGAKARAQYGPRIIGVFPARVR